MVMEASPSPQSVGREFVRQYYTLLNKAPAHLHRFYNNFSSFVHGGLDAPNRETLPVVGQKQIHNRIQQLNFRDCHAKITQVDSQATLCNSVVVQVTGELSNAGAPMRRFTQTFVLAEQSPKKYYVHNDIFRYQDMLSDEEGEVEDNHSETEDEPLQPMQPLSISAPPAEQSPPVAYFAPAFVPPAPLAPLAPAINGIPIAVATQEQSPSPQMIEVPPVQIPQGLQNALVPPVLAVVEEAAEPVVVAAVEELEEEPREAEPEPIPPQKSPEPILPPAAPEPKTYANLLKSGGYQQPPTQRTNNGTPVTRTQPPPPASSPPAPAPQRPRSQRPPRQDNTESNSGGGRRPFSDSLQLFLGNVPSSATEEELRAMFGQFGSIAELRVLCKAGPPSSVRQHSNYGFVTYDDPQAVQSCLNARPLYFPADNPEGQVLNVEEKRARSRDMGGSGGAPRGAGGSGGGRGPRGPPRPPFGASRGPPPYRR